MRLIAVWPEAVTRIDPDYRGGEYHHIGERVRLSDGRLGKWIGWRYLVDDPPGGTVGHPDHGVCHVVEIDGRSRITNPSAICELRDVTAQLHQ